MVNGWTVPGFTHAQDLGGGTAGRVVLAVDDLTQTKVAIKYLDPRLDADEAFLSRFRSVARRLSQLEDPNVVDFFDFVETPKGTAIVMERVEGVTLGRILAGQGSTGPLAALSMLGGALLGLAAAHELEIVHGAVRPVNILIDPAGESAGNPRLTDFALTPAGTEAQAGPSYAAPELWNGSTASVAADLYAITAIFFECLTGRPPFTGRSQSALAKAHREAPIPVEEVPGPLRDVIAHGLAKEPDKRPASAADFLAAVEEAAVAAYGPSWEAQGHGRLTELAQQAAAAPAPPAAKTRASGRHPVTAAPAGRGRGKIIVAAVAALVIAGGLAGAATLLGGAKDEPPQPNTSGSPQPVPPAVPGSPEAMALSQRFEQLTARAPGAAFTFRRSGCCGGPVSARGTFAVVPGGPESYSMTVSGAADTRKPAKTVLVGETAYVRAGAKWRPIAVAGQTRGYPALTAQARSGSSPANLNALLRAATSFKKVGNVYQGTAPMAQMSRAPMVGPMYAELARATGARQVGFAVRLDRASRPMHVWVKVGSGSQAQVLSTTYAGWSRKTITPPR